MAEAKGDSGASPDPDLGSMDVIKLQRQLSSIYDKLATHRSAVAACRAEPATITRRELEQVRHYSNPALPVRRTVELMYVILEAASLEPQSALLAAVSGGRRRFEWQRRGGVPKGGLVGYLASASLTDTILSYASCGDSHPLNTSPTVAQFITDVLAPQVGAATPPQAGKAAVLSLERVTRASSAAGSLLKWCLAQLKLASALAPIAELQLQHDALIAELANRGEVAESKSDSTPEPVDEGVDEGAKVAEEDSESEGKCAPARAAPSPAPPAPSLRRVEVPARLQVLLKRTITFDHGQSEVPEVSLPAIKSVVHALRSSPHLVVSIEGHSEEAEEKEGGSEVSQARAEAVAEYMIAQGVPAARLRATGYGSSFASATSSSSPGTGRGAGSGSRTTSTHRTSGSGNRRVAFNVVQELEVAGKVAFSPMSARLQPSSRALLEGVVQLLQARPHLCVRVEGHCDSAPMWGGMTSQQLSEDRAQSVQAYLTSSSAGVDAEQVTAQGFAHHRPIASNATREGKAANRRVEFHLLPREGELRLRRMAAVADTRTAIAEDEAAVSSLREVAAGRVAEAAPDSVRLAAARLLVACEVDWEVYRLLLLAARKGNPSTCPLAMLNDDTVRHVVLMKQLLGIAWCTG